MRTRTVSLLAGCIFLAGCTAPFTEAPKATKFKATEQRKLQSAYHWKVIADDAAAQLLAQLETTLCTRHQSVCTRGLHEGRKLYIKQRYEDTQFQRAFKQSLMTALIAANVFRITKNPNDSDVLIIDVNTEYVRWADRARRDPMLGEMSTLTSGLWVLRHVYRNVSPGAAMVGAGMSIDAYFAANPKLARGPRPKHELVVSVSASDDQYYYANTNNVYYTTEKDFYPHHHVHKRLPAPQLPFSKIPVRGE